MAKRKHFPEPAVEIVEETAEIKKGDKVLLLQSIYDGMQVLHRESVIAWPFDNPPTPDQATLVERQKAGD